jgi:hypothetical protein
MSTNDKEDESKLAGIPTIEEDETEDDYSVTPEELVKYAKIFAKEFIKNPEKNFSYLETILIKMQERPGCYNIVDGIVDDLFENEYGIKRDKINGIVVITILQAWWTYLMSLRDEDKLTTAFSLLHIIEVDDVLNHYKLKGNIDNLKEEITIFELLEEAHIEEIRTSHKLRQGIYIPSSRDNYHSVDLTPLKEKLRKERPFEYQELIEEENRRKEEKAKKAKEMNFWNS